MSGNFQHLWHQISDEEWNDWRWQMSHRITSLRDLLAHVSLRQARRKQLKVFSAAGGEV